MSIPAPPATRSRSLDSDSLTGSLSDSGFASSSSTPPTVDTSATSDDDEQPQRVPRELPQMSDKHKRPPRRASSTTTTTTPDAYLSCSSSLLRTTLLSFARIGLPTSISSPTSSSSRRSSISSPSSTGSPIEPPNLHAKSTTEVCTNSNPSLAQFSPTPRASSALAVYAPHVGFVSSTYSSTTSASTSRRYGARSRSASLRHQHAQTAHAGSRPRPQPHAVPFRADDDPSSPPSDSVTSPRSTSLWRKQQQATPLHPSAQRASGVNAPTPPSILLPSISRAHVPDLVLPIDIDGSSGGSTASTAASNGFLKIDGSRDGLSFRTAENGSGGKIISSTPRPSYPISQCAEHDDEVAVVVDSPVGNDYDGQPNLDARDWKGKGKERATIPNEFYTGSAATGPLPASSASRPTQQRQTRVKIILPPTPVRASSTPVLKPRPTPPTPTLSAIEKTSRLMRDRVHCATCAAVGVDFPRCPRCSEAWCSRDCRVARLDQLADGRRKHVCAT